MGFFPASARATILDAPDPDPAEQPLSFWDGYAAVEESTRLTDRSDSLAYQVQEPATRSLRRLASLTGQRFDFPTYGWSNNLSESALAELERNEATILEYRKAAGEGPDLLKTASEIRAEAEQRVKDARALASRAGWGATLAGAGWTQIKDPLNVALLPFGVFGAETLLARIGVEAVVAAGSQALVETASLPAKDFAGVTPTLGESAANVALTGTLGGALGGLFHGAGVVAKRAAMLADYRAKVKAGTIVPTRATDAAADSLEDIIDTIPPGTSPGAEAAHLEAVAAGVDLLRAEHPVEAADAAVRFEAKARAIVTAEDRRIAAMSLDEWMASRPAAEPGTDPTVDSVLAMTGIKRDAPGAAGVSRVDISGDEVVYLFRSEDGQVRGALHGFLSADGSPELASIAVDAGAQRQGIGKQLLASARRDFPDADAAAVQEMAGLTDAGARLRYRDAVAAVTAEPPTELAVEFVARERAALLASKPPKAEAPSSKYSPTVMAEVRRRGGLDVDAVRRDYDWKRDVQQAGILTAMRRGGTAPDDMAATLVEEGIIPPGSTGDDLMGMLKGRDVTTTAAESIDEGREGYRLATQSALAYFDEIEQGAKELRDQYGIEPRVSEVEDYLEAKATARLDARWDDRSLVDNAVASEMDAPMPAVETPRVDAPLARPSADPIYVEADATLRAIIDENPDATVTIEIDGVEMTGRAADIAADIDRQIEELGGTVDCLLGEVPF